MTIEDCYLAMGGDYAQVQKRLPSAALIKRFVAKFLSDDSFDQLCRAMQAGQREEAFRAAHTLKGVCANLGFDRLYGSASRLTEELRPEGSVIPAAAAELLAKVEQDYAETTGAIRTYLGEA
ncbi:MAG: Hpt domain-containing protein [Candidatus Ventricola sp.]